MHSALIDTRSRTRTHRQAWANETSEEREVDRLEQIAYWLDSAFRVPGIGLRFGFDAILDLLPGVGDALGALLSMYIFQAARRFGVPRVTLARMAMNIGIDYIGGLVPFFGAIFDAYWKANIWNVGLLKRHIKATPQEARRARRGDGVFVALCIVGLVLFMVATFALFALAIALVAQFFAHIGGPRNSII